MSHFQCETMRNKLFLLSKASLTTWHRKHIATRRLTCWLSQQQTLKELSPQHTLKELSPQQTLKELSPQQTLKEPLRRHQEICWWLCRAVTS
eukprot:366242-Chlamydomonas_euryale.AAC.11